MHWHYAVCVFIVTCMGRSKVLPVHLIMYRSVPQIRPPFATLALVQNIGGAYTWDAAISLAITPSLPIKHDSLGGGWRPSTRRRQTRGGEMLPTQWDEKAGCFREVTGVSIVDVGGIDSRVA